MTPEIRFEATDALLTEAERIGEFGSWEWEIRSDRATWSPGLFRIFGLDPQQTPTSYQSFLSLVHPEDRERTHAAIQGVLQSGGRLDVEYRIIRPDGQIRRIHSRGQLKVDERGAPLRMTGTGQDITARWLLEEERDRLFDLSPDLLCVARMDGHFDRVNPAFERILGYSPDELRSIPFLSLIHDEDRPATLAQLAALNNGEVTASFENRYRCKDGSYRVLQWNATPFLQTGVLYAVGRDVTEQRRSAAQREALIREQAARAAAVESERRARFLSEASAVLSSSLDYETTLRNVAEQVVQGPADWCAVDLVEPGGGLRRLAIAHPDPRKSELIRVLAERYPPDPEAKTGTPQVVRTGQPELVPRITDEVLVRVARDEEHLRILRQLNLCSYMIVPLIADGVVLGALALASGESGHHFDDDDLEFARELAHRAALAIDNARLHREVQRARDLLEEQTAELEMQAEELQAQAVEMEANQAELESITEELQQTNETLQQISAEAEEARARAEEANAAKSQFLANMSHELRTPLNAIGGYAELLEMEIYGPVTPTQRDSLVRIRRNQTHLLGLINDILNFAKLEAGQVHYEITDVPVDEVLAEMEAMIEPQIGAKQLRYAYRSGDPSVVARADRDRLQQIVLNLLTNATKFTSPGGRVELEWDAHDARIAIRVRDTGPGIPADKVQRIFDPFVQVERVGRMDGEGVGLGLAISRDLARGLGGDLDVESVEGKGSTFVLTLPRAASP